MAILCAEHRLLFIMVPGTGCSAVGKHLVEHLGGRYVPESDFARGGRVIVGRKHNTVGQIVQHGLLSQNEIDDLTVVATVRNPFDRMVTYYQRLSGDWVEYYLGVRERRLEREAGDLSAEEMTVQRRALEHAERRLARRQRLVRAVGFDAWALATGVRWRWARRGEDTPMRSVLFPMLDGVDVALRYERLGEAYEALLERLGATVPEPLPRRNPTPGKKPYASYYAAPTKVLLTRLFGRELDAFGYSFEGPTDDRLLIRLDEAAQSPARSPQLSASR